MQEKIKPLQDYLRSFQDAIDGKKPFSKAELRKQIVGLVFSYKQLEEQKAIKDKDNDFLFTQLRKLEKKIPIPTQAQGLIDWDKPLYANLHRLKINDVMKDLLKGKTAYCLRHTFATVCQQYVRPDIVDIWMGDSPQRLVGKVYTHFPDEFMLEEMQKVQFPLP